MPHVFGDAPKVFGDAPKVCGDAPEVCGLMPETAYMPDGFIIIFIFTDIIIVNSHSLRGLAPTAINVKALRAFRLCDITFNF
jgi:hypothetical protein